MLEKKRERKGDGGDVVVPRLGNVVFRATVLGTRYTIIPCSGVA